MINHLEITSVMKAMTETEEELFAREMADVRRINASDKVELKRVNQNDPGQQYRRESASRFYEEVHCPLSLVLRQQLTQDDWLSFKRNGIQTGVFKNLRIGHYAHEANLNLNQKTPQQARDELVQFVADCTEANIRSVLIFFGHGKSGRLLKSYLHQWLPELEQVQAFHTAQKHHGGSAAVYVLFRKSEQKRTENRERHASKLGHAL